MTRIDPELEHEPRPSAAPAAGEPEAPPESADTGTAVDAADVPTSTWTLVTICFAVATAAVAVAFQTAYAESWKFWAALAVPYGLLAAYAVRRMSLDGTLWPRLAVRGGDVTIGVLVGALLLFASWAGRTSLTPPGTEENAWLLRIYAQVGAPEIVQRSVALTLLLLAIVVCEELVWRGLVVGKLTARLGWRRGWIIAALLYGLTLTPTLFTLGVPVAGPNPLLLVAALGAGLVWSFMARMLQRLPPIIISHAMFTYFSVVQFRLPGL